MIIILYLSVALIAIAFLVLVIYLSKTLKSFRVTLDSAAKTLEGLEKQVESVTKETAVLLKKTNALADDIQRKSESLNSVVDAVKDVGTTVGHFNQTLQNITNTVDVQVENNKEKVAQILQWGNVLLELKDKWKEKRKKTSRVKKELLMSDSQKARSK